MTNYAEEIAYWYLRLNGFFPLTNYVYHRLPMQYRSARYNADADILAIMPPFYYETIFFGEKEQQLKSADWLKEFQGKWIGVIAEVKGNRSVTVANVQRAFSTERLRVAVGRLGFAPKETIGEIVEELQNNPIWQKKRYRYVFVKILFCMVGSNVYYHPSPLWKMITLNEADRFIRRRINEFPDPKSGGRYFFPGTMFQYMIWRERDSHFDK